MVINWLIQNPESAEPKTPKRDNPTEKLATLGFRGSPQANSYTFPGWYSRYLGCISMMLTLLMIASKSTPENRSEG